MADIISNAKIYCDFPAGVGSPGGNILLDFGSSLKETDGRSTEVVKAIGKKRGAGFRRKSGGGMLALTENRHNKHQINWWKLKASEVVFTITVQDENGGMRQKYLKCTISKIDTNRTDENEHTNEIEIAFLDATP